MRNASKEGLMSLPVLHLQKIKRTNDAGQRFMRQARQVLPTAEAGTRDSKTY